MAEAATDPQAFVEPKPNVTGLIGWFATNHVAANLMLFFVIAAGLVAAWQLKKEMFPQFTTGMIQVSMQLRGGTPEDVEQGIILKIENAIQTVDGIKSTLSTAGEGSGRVLIEIEEGEEILEVLDEIKLSIDSINSFPNDAERPVIREYTQWTQSAINVVVSGDVDEQTLKSLSEGFLNEILSLEEVSYAELNGTRPYEISIEVSEHTLREYRLTMQQIAQVIQAWSVDMGGGSIESLGGDIRVRAKGQSYTGEDFGNIVLLTHPDGTRVTLGDVATINDGFADYQWYSLFNGKPALSIAVMTRLNENAIDIAAAVREWVERRSHTLPESIELGAWGDSSYYLNDRLQMMLKNMALGAGLVFVMLGIFLRLKIALWVVVGLPMAFLGAFMLLPYVGVTVNIISLFGFILVIGIVVDDAIIIAESADAETSRHGYNVENIVKGAQRVAVPATFGVLTTVAAFAPMLLAGGRMSLMMANIGWVVVLCLLFSLVESKLILPSHLALMKRSHGKKKGLADWVEKQLYRFIDGVFKPFVVAALEFRYTTLSIFVGLLILTVGLVMGGVVRVGFFPTMESDMVSARASFLEGTPEQVVLDYVDRMTSAVDEINAEIRNEYGVDDDTIKYAFTSVQGGTSVRINSELTKSENRVISPCEITRRWRDKVGEVAGTEEVSYNCQSGYGGGGAGLQLALQSANTTQLEAAADELTEYLKEFDGLYDVKNSARTGPSELKLSVKREGEAAGLTLSSLARQVRQAFYGYEVQRVQRGDSEVRVFVRYPKTERTSIGNLESMWVRLPDGSQAPFYSVASYSQETGYQSIRRRDGKRTLSVSAEVDFNVVQPQMVLLQAERNFIPQLLQTYPAVSATLTGTSREERMGLNELLLAFAAALVFIYALIAIPLKSYVQPLVIMSVIPFGIIGAMLGHLLVDQFTPTEFNMASMIGCIALSGVVVNDSLLLVHYVNRKLSEGNHLVDAILRACRARFRAILLTSFTTFFGLVPILLEKSLSTKMVAPMAVSIAFGILFATTITLILVPTLLRTIADFGWRKNTLQRPRREDPTLQAGSVPSDAVEATPATSPA